MELISRILRQVRYRNYYPDAQVISGRSTGPVVRIGSKDVLMFSSNNYLGLAGDPRIEEKVIEGVKRYGMGSGGSRLVSGNLDIHQELEHSIARFKHAEAAIVFSTGYMANLAVVPALARHYPLVLCDEFNHASIVDGCQLSKAKCLTYKHRDMEDFSGIVASCDGKRKLIVTDSVFSMDGDIARLPELAQYKKHEKVMLMIDDAHASGVLGPNGRGAMDHFSLTDGVDVVMGTFTKAFGGVGGFVCGSKDFTDYLRLVARTYIFTAPIPPPICAGLLEALRIVESEPERRRKLWDNVTYLRRGLQQLGFNLLESETQIMPVMIGDEQKAISLSRELLEEGVFAPCIRWPAVPHSKARLRVTVMSSHERHHLDRLIDVLGRLGRKFGIVEQIETEGVLPELAMSSLP